MLFGNSGEASEDAWGYSLGCPALKRNLLSRLLVDQLGPGSIQEEAPAAD